MDSFRCACGAVSLVYQGNGIVFFPDGRTERFCHNGCLAYRRAEKEARFARRLWAEKRVLEAAHKAATRAGRPLRRAKSRAARTARKQARAQGSAVAGQRYALSTLS